MSHEYEKVRRLSYNGALFVPVCEKCGRFVRAHETIRFQEAGNGPVVDEPNATCRKCGATKMIFEGYY